MKIFNYGLVLLCSVALWGCSKGNSDVAIDPTTGKHIAGWATNVAGGLHPAAYLGNPDSCKTCHGEKLDGGISKVSCSNPGRSGVNCHAVFPHPAGFASFAQVNGSFVSNHATVAKSAASTNSGMGYCKNCHGAGYAGNGPAPSCVACHRTVTTYDNSATNAPHAGRWATYLSNPWGLNHSTVDESNAVACAQCHANKANLSVAGAARVAGAAPGAGGCFDNSLCHGNMGHTFTRNDHYQYARSNLASCQQCHGTPSSGLNPRFNIPRGSLTGNGCELCHQRPGLAHPYIWLPNRGESTLSSHANAENVFASCGLCHGGNALSGGAAAKPGGISPPSCFPGATTQLGGTNCHASLPVIPFGVINAGVTVGCISCHGTPPNGSAFPNTANAHAKHTALAGVSCATCHTGAGTGTTGHSNGTTTVAFTLLAGASASFNTTNKNCTNVACHNGVATPAWTAANSNGCAMCHSAASSLTTGNSLTRHNAHLVTVGLKCNACHTDGPGVPAHTTGLAAAAVIGQPFPVKYSENLATYDAVSKKCSNVSCHGGKTTNFPVWTSVTAFNITACINCHVDYASVPSVPPALYNGPYIGPFGGNQSDGFGGVMDNLHAAHLSFWGPSYRATYCAFCHTVPAAAQHFANITSGKRLLRPGTASFTIIPNVYIQSVAKDAQGIVTSCVTFGSAPVGGVVYCHSLDDTTPTPRPWY